MSEPATEKQLDYISTLAVDCNFTLAQRLAYIRRLTHRDSLTCLSDLSKFEASQIINGMKAIKEAKRLSTTTDDSASSD